MSKIHTDILDGIIRKSKMKRQMRQYETNKKKNTRLRNAENNVYNGFIDGYYVISERYENKKETIVIPEKQKEIGHIENIPMTIWDGNGFVDIIFPKWISDGIEIIPAREKKIRVGRNYYPIKPRVIRINSGKKNYRKIASKKFRHKRKDYAENGSLYRKDYDVRWMMW